MVKQIFFEYSKSSVFEVIDRKNETVNEEPCETCDNTPCACTNCSGCGYDTEDCQCDVCGNCNYSYDNCKCCGDCECYPCQCDSHEDCECSACVPKPQTYISYGKYTGIETQPVTWPKELWEPSTEGIQETAWKETWDLTGTEIRLSKVAAEFYMLEALTSKTIYPHKIEPTQSMIMRGMTETAVDKIVNEAKRQLDTLVQNLDDIFTRYTIMAVGGESRHHRAIGGIVLPGPDHRPWAWRTWKPIYDHVGPQAVLDIIPYFEEMGGSFGGQAWVNVCRILHSRLVGELPPHLFVDRCFTLQHNSGCFFNKVFSVSGMDAVLPLHGRDEFPAQSLMDWCGEETKTLWERYWQACNTYMGLELTYA